MPEIRGFRAVRFNKEAVGDLSLVVTPPFDVISPDERVVLVGRSPYNMARLTLPEPNGTLDKYSAAGRDFHAWLERGVFRQDEEDSFYLLEQTFRGPDGNDHVRRAFFAAVRIPEPGEDTILEHERTFDAKTTDRLQLQRATEANLGAVFGIYDDPHGQLRAFLDIMGERPADDCARTIDGVTQRLWRVPGHAEVTAFFRDKTVYIADGHHRFRTAVVYRDEMRARAQARARRPEYEYVLMGFVSFQDPGLAIWPAHRLLDAPEGFALEPFLARLAGWFTVTPVEGDPIAALKRAPGCAIGFAVHGGGQYVLTLDESRRGELLGADRTDAWRSLDVAVLHRGILERFLGLAQGVELTYEPKAEKALAVVQSGTKQLGFFLKGITPQQIRACAEAHDCMPQKATYFYPKLPTGMAIHLVQ